MNLHPEKAIIIDEAIKTVTNPEGFTVKGHGPSTIEDEPDLAAGQVVVKPATDSVNP